MTNHKSVYQELKEHSFDERSLARNIDKMVAKGKLDEGDAYVYYKDLLREIKYRNDS